MHRLVTFTLTVLLLALAGVAVAVARDAARSFGGLLSRCLSRGPHARRRGARELRLVALVGLGLLLGAMMAMSGCSSPEEATGPQPGTQPRSAGATVSPIPLQPTATAAAAEPEAATAESTSPDPAPATSPTSPRLSRAGTAVAVEAVAEDTTPSRPASGNSTPVPEGSAAASPAIAARSPRVEIPEAQPDDSEGSAVLLVAGRGGARRPVAGLTAEATTDARGAASSFEQGAGPEYTWQDGDDTRTVRLESSLTVTPGSGDDDGRASVVPRSEQGAGAGSLPVFRSGSGALMTLPGGILLLLDPDWDEARIDQFFADHQISQDRVSERAFGENAFFVETALGFPALELANALAGQTGVLVSSPNWKREATLN